MSRTPSIRGLFLAMLIAVAVLAVGGAIAVRPAVVLDAVPELESVLVAIDPELSFVLFVSLLVLAAPMLTIAGRFRTSPTEPLVDRPSRAAGRAETPAPTRDAVGATVDEYVALATDYDGAPRDRREEARGRVVEALRPIAATAYANRAGLADAEATTAVETGTWTDDPRAAAFLASEDGPSTPLSIWLFDLLSATDPFARALDRTIDEIERLQSTATVSTGDAS